MTLPDFLIVGAPRSGTSSMHRYLREHPDIFLPSRKELHYFSFSLLTAHLNGPGDEDVPHNLCETLNEYERHFADAGNEKAVGEVSPSYLLFNECIPEIKRVLGDKVRIINLINHTSGLDIEETNQSILNPESMFVRFVYSAMGVTDRTVKLENWMNILREAQPLETEKPGQRFRYSSLNTQVLGLVIENVTGLRWADVVEQRIWGKMGARMPLLTSLSPDGQALTMAIMSSTLEDMGRFGVLFTPSWRAAAYEQVVTPQVLERIRKDGDPAAFTGGAKERQAISLFGEKPLKSSYQFDFIFEDGAMYKHGNMGQGIYIDPERDFVAVYFSTTPYVAPYGEIKAPAYFRAAAKMLSKK